MAKGLPANFALDLPEQEGPVEIGDFLDEPPAVYVAPKGAFRGSAAVSGQLDQRFTPSIVPGGREGEIRTTPVHTVRQKAARPKPSRLQVNLTPKAEDMFTEVMEHVKNFSPYDVANATEVFQGLLGLLHGALDELDLSELPRRGAWGSVTARNFPSALAETFESALLRSVRKRGVRS
jgi:hypothetical protein